MYLRDCTTAGCERKTASLSATSSADNSLFRRHFKCSENTNALRSTLLKNIFFKNAPLHDGAVLIEGDRIVAAKCILPVTQSDVPKSYGTRHRAAIGMSEISDAIIIVVSEETGGISIAQGGELRRDIDPVRLQQTLQRYLTINTRKRSKKEVAE